MRTALFKIAPLTIVGMGLLNKLVMICSIRARKGQKQHDLRIIGIDWSMWVKCSELKTVIILGVLLSAYKLQAGSSAVLLEDYLNLALVKV